MTNQINRIISGALLLTLAGIASKILSAMYRVPLQNLTGDIGFYTYQQIYPIIATVIVLSLYGFPMAVSRLIANEHANVSQDYMNQHVGPLFIVLFTINLFIGVSLLITAPVLANMMHDERLKLPLQLSSSLFLFIPFLALFRGVFQAELQMKQTALSQLIEQFIRVSIIIASAWLIFRGKIQVEYIAEASVVASFLSMFAVTGFMFFLFVRYYGINTFSMKVKTINWSYYIKTVITFGIIASLNHLTLILIQFVDVLTLVPNLIKAGFSPQEAMEQKGIFDRGIPLIQFGIVLGSSFALAFIPSLSMRRREQQQTAVQDAFSIGFYVAAGATAGLIVLYHDVNRLLFKDDVNTIVLQVLAISILLLSLSITATAVLQAYDYVVYTVVSLITALVAKLLFNYLLVPFFGTLGSALATVLSLLVLTMLIFVFLYKKLKFSPLQRMQWLPFTAALIVMSVFLEFVRWTFPSNQFTRLGLLFYVLFLVIAGGVLYLTVLLRYDVIKERHIIAMPFSKKIMRYYKFVKKRNMN